MGQSKGLSGSTPDERQIAALGLGVDLLQALLEGLDRHR
jgi:hypothetical protein